MKKYICFTFILIFLLFGLTGCYDSTGIEEYYYIVAIGIDKAEDNLITLSVQNAKPTTSTDSSSSQSNEYKIYSVKCKSVESGINILNNYLNKKINLSHCSAVVISEELAKEGIINHINVLGNDTEIRPNCNVIVSSKKASDILDKVANSGEGFSARLYEYILSSVDYTGYTIDVTFNDFFSKINSDETQGMAIYSYVGEDTIQNGGAAIFKGDRMVGTISPLESIAHLLITNNLDACVISVKNPFKQGDVIDLNLKQLTSPDIDVNLINNTPFINIDLSLESSINSSGEQFDYTVPENVKQVEDIANNYLATLIKEYLYLISKNYNSDTIGFGGLLASKFLTLNDYDKVHWNEIFKDAFFNVNVNTTITSSQLFNKE